LSPVHTTVADAMTGNVATCSEHQEIAGAASLMKSLRVRRLPVVNDAEQLVGMVTLANIAESGDPSLTGELLQKICEPSAEMLAT
jgi:CBS domain-containing protein